MYHTFFWDTHKRDTMDCLEDVANVLLLPPLSSQREAYINILNDGKRYILVGELTLYAGTYEALPEESRLFDGPLKEIEDFTDLPKHLHTLFV